MVTLLVGLLALILFYFAILPVLFGLSFLVTVEGAAVVVIVLTVLHVWVNERLFGNQEDINRNVFGARRGESWPVTDRHNRWLHQGFIAWWNIGWSIAALATGEPICLAPPASVFAADFVQHAGFNAFARAPVAGFPTAVLYGCFFLFWYPLQTNEPSLLFRAALASGWVLIFGNLGTLWLKNRVLSTGRRR